jgi:hypothetical protein
MVAFCYSTICRVYEILTKPSRLKAGIAELVGMSIDRQRLDKQVSAETDTQETIEELLGTMFSVRSVQNGYKRRDLVNWILFRDPAWRWVRIPPP